MRTLKARTRWKGARTLGFPGLSLCCYAPVCTLCTFWAFLRFLGFLARTQKEQTEVELKLVYLFSGNCSRQNSREKFLRLLGDLPTRRSLSLSSDHPPLLFGPKNFFPSPQTTPARGEENIFRLLGANFGATLPLPLARLPRTALLHPSKGRSRAERRRGPRDFFLSS